MPPSYRLHTDGGARGNPGPAGIGVVLATEDGEVVAKVSKGIGWATNNVAEYRALLEGLQLARSAGADTLKVFMDSELIVRQMKGLYRVKHAGLRQLHSEARSLMRTFQRVEFEEVPREQNSEADALVNEAIDEWLIENPDYSPPKGPAQQELL